MNENNHLELKTALRRNLIRATLVPLQSGCLAFAMATIAILAGIWLDFRLETFPLDPDFTGWQCTHCVGDSVFRRSADITRVTG